MVYEIVWTPKAMESFVENMEYLQNKWTQKEVDQFISIVEEKISLLSFHPEIGSPRSKMQLNIRQTILHKRVLLIYRVKPKSKIS